MPRKGVSVARIPIRLPVKSKYYAKRTDGYASKKEAKRAGELGLWNAVGIIGRLQKQVSFEIIPKDALGPAIRYVADFVYWKLDDRGAFEQVVEDVKGFKTAAYRLKKRLMFQVHGIKISEL
jgi:hypothetical protein